MTDDKTKAADDASSARMLERVRKLLAKAERAGSEHEAEAFTAKATELMLKYAIDEAMLQRSGEKRDERVVARTFTVKGYAKAKLELLRRVARGLGMDAAFYSNDRRGWSEGRAEVVGWESDMDSLEVLFASLQMQAAHEASREVKRIKAEWPALRAARDEWDDAVRELDERIWRRNAKADASRMHCPNGHDQGSRSWLDAQLSELTCRECETTWTPLPHLSYGEKRQMRQEFFDAHPEPEDPGREMPHGRAFMQSFLIGYAGVVGARLAKQRRETVKEADDSAPGTALAVVDRDKAVEKFAHERWTYGGSAGRGASTSSNAGYYSGRAAGARANLGGRSVGGGHKAIGR